MSLPVDPHSGVVISTDATGAQVFTLPEEGHAILIDGREFRLHWTEVIDGAVVLCGRSHVRRYLDREPA
jgi:hypothetical protein